MTKTEMRLGKVEGRLENIEGRYPSKQSSIIISRVERPEVGSRGCKAPWTT